MVGTETWVVLFGAVAVYALVAGWLGARSITMPLVFVAVGIVAGPHVLGAIDLPLHAEGIERLIEITLALLLFADASTLDWRAIRADAWIPARLLVVGLPLTVAVGALTAGLLFPGAGLGMALLLGAILAPTDAALGLPIFSNERVPMRVRRALNVESGFNDGVSTPFVTLALAFVVAEATPGNPGSWIPPALAEIAIAIVVGGLLGVVGGRAFLAAETRGLTTPVALQLGGLALALLGYWGSIAAGGNGYIAAFVAGLAFGAASDGKLAAAGEFPEVSGTLLSLLVWVIFGAMVAPLAFTHFVPAALLYAVLALTVARMLPVAIALAGTRLRADTVLMMGWLGPRGLASVVFTLIALGTLTEAGIDPTPLSAAVWAVLLSVALHAVTAVPLASWYAGRLEAAGPGIPEFAERGRGLGVRAIRVREALGHALAIDRHRGGTGGAG